MANYRQATRKQVKAINMLLNATQGYRCMAYSSIFISPAFCCRSSPHPTLPPTTNHANFALCKNHASKFCAASIAFCNVSVEFFITPASFAAKHSSLRFFGFRFPKRNICGQPPGWHENPPKTRPNNSHNVNNLQAFPQHLSPPDDTPPAPPAPAFCVSETLNP